MNLLYCNGLSSLVFLQYPMHVSTFAFNTYFLCDFSFRYEFFDSKVLFIFKTLIPGHSIWHAGYIEPNKK